MLFSSRHDYYAYEQGKKKKSSLTEAYYKSVTTKKRAKRGSRGSKPSKPKKPTQKQNSKYSNMIDGDPLFSKFKTKIDVYGNKITRNMTSKDYIFILD